jgi:hypothetical protein
MESATEKNRPPKLRSLLLKRAPDRNDSEDWVKDKGENVW